MDPKLFISKIMEEDNQKVAIVKIVEDGPTFITKMEDLKINDNPVEYSILEEEDITKLQLDQRTLAPAPSGFYVNIQFCKFAEIPTREDIEKKIIQVGLESPQKWRKSVQDTISMFVAGEEDQKEKIKTALEDLEFGENIAVSVREGKKKDFVVKVSQEENSIRLTNIPLDWDSKRLKAAIKRSLVFEFGIHDCKDGEAQISYSVGKMDLADKLDGMKVGGSVVKVVREKTDEAYVIPEDWTEDKVKEALGIDKLVPLEIQVKDEKVALLFKPTKENLPGIIKELTKLRPQPLPVEPDAEEVKEEKEEELTEEGVEEEKEDSKEELKEKESKDDTKEKEETPQMIDGKPVVFASTDIREKKKAQAQVEEAEQTNANIINVNEAEDE